MYHPRTINNPTFLGLCFLMVINLTATASMGEKKNASQAYQCQRRMRGNLCQHDIVEIASGPVTTDPSSKPKAR